MAVPETREIRDTVDGLELRSAPEGSRSPGTMVGYAAVFGKESCDLGCFRETLAPGCFRDAIARCDVRALVNHDPNLLLGRKSAGTLRLMEDDRGLRVEIDLPDTTVGRDTAESLRRGDLQGQSFSFTTPGDGSGESWDTSSEPWMRTVRRVDELFDVGPVAFPAYEDTTAALRAYRAILDAATPLPAPTPDPSIAVAIARSRDTARLRLLEAF